MGRRLNWLTGIKLKGYRRVKDGRLVFFLKKKEKGKVESLSLSCVHTSNGWGVKRQELLTLVTDVETEGCLFRCVRSLMTG